MAMVRRGYGPVYRPRSVEFGALQDESGQIVQLVELIGPDGQAYTARYTMERETDGSWRISACELLESRRVGTWMREGVAALRNQAQQAGAA